MKPINIILSFACMVAVATGAGLILQSLMSFGASSRSGASFGWKCLVVAGTMLFFLWVLRTINRTFDPYISAAKRAAKAVENRLDELERLKRREMVTPEEYATKRQEILKDL